MGMLDFLSGKPKEQRTMLYFKENGNARFEKMDIEDTFFLEKKNGRVLRAWKNFYKLMLPFEGYKNIKRDMVTLAYARDIIYDPFGGLSDDERPNAVDIKPWVAEVLNGQRHKRQQESDKKMALTTQIALLSIPTILIFVGVFVVIIVNMKGGG